MLLALVPGKRDDPTCERLIRQARERAGGRANLLLARDEHAPYETAIPLVYGVETPRPDRPGQGHPPKPVKIVPAELCYATVRKRREKGRMVEVVRTLVFLNVMPRASVRHTEAVKASPARKEKYGLLQDIPGLVPVSNLTLLAALPELGTLNGGKISSLVDLASFADDLGTRRCRRPV